MVPTPDLIVLTRGGGSIEDLWPFNAERLVRAIDRSRLPIVTGVGHEIDVTLADLVADFRALTPSEAAERIVPNINDVKQWLAAAGQRLRSTLADRLQTADQQLQWLASRPVLNQPLTRVNAAAMELDDLENAMHRCIQRSLSDQAEGLNAVAERLNVANPLQILNRGYSLTSDEQGALVTQCRNLVTGQKIRTRIVDGTVVSVVQTVEPERKSGQEKNDK